MAEKTDDERRKQLATAALAELLHILVTTKPSETHEDLETGESEDETTASDGEYPSRAGARVFRIGGLPRTRQQPAETRVDVPRFS